jgi:hypothetical protein
MQTRKILYWQINVFILQYQILGEGAYRQDILHNTTANDSNPYGM